MTETATDTGRLPSEEDFAAALDWWREAGLDCDFADDATDWLARPIASAGAEAVASAAGVAPPIEPVPSAPPPRPVEKASPTRFGGDSRAWPSDLASFREWWMTEPSLETGGTGPRIGPRGAAGAALMIIVAHPEEQDRETLLSGPEGALLDGFLRAAGIAPHQTYHASLLPRFSAAPDWPTLRQAGCGEVLAHHVALVQPQRLLILGGNIPPLLGHDTAQEGKTLRCFNHKGRSFPCVEGEGLAVLLRKAARRRDLWQSWLDGTA